MQTYKIKTTDCSVHVWIDGEIKAEYGLYRDPFAGRVESARTAARKLRAEIDQHLAQPGATLGNYQW